MSCPYNIPKNHLIEFPMGIYLFQQELGTERLLFIDAVTGAPLTVPDPTTGHDALPTVAWFSEMLRTDQVVIKAPPSKDGVRRAAREAEWDAMAIHEMDPQAAMRLAVVKVLDDEGVPNGIKAIGLGLIEHWDAEMRARFGAAPNPHTIKRWRSDRGHIGDRKLRDMVSMTGKVERRPQLPQVVHEVVQKHALSYYTSNRSVQDTYAAVGTEIDLINEGRSAHYARPEVPHTIPSYDTVRLAVRALECADTYGAKHGKNAVRSRWRGAGKPLTASRALELGIADHTRLPVYCVDPERCMPLGQPWLTLNVDVATRAITGSLVVFEPPSLWSVAELVRRSNRPKIVPLHLAERYPGLATICGKHSELIVDNGSEFVGHGFEDAAADIGMGVRFCPVGEPQYKAIGERAFRTIIDYLIKKLPGASYDIPQMREFGYDPEKHALLTLKELEALLEEAIAVYHISLHGGLNERQPLLMWEKSVARHKIDLIGNVKELDRSIGAMEPEATITKSGVDLFCNDYGDHRLVPELLDDLARLEPRRKPTKNPKATVKVKYDPMDISKIHVWNRVTKKYVTLTCNMPEYAEGMPLWLHNRIREFARAEANDFNTLAERLAARNHLTESIMSISPEATARERRLLARLYGTPRLRAITGDIAALHEEEPSTTGMPSAVQHDLNTGNRVDGEILSPRPRRGDKSEKRDRRDSGKARSSTSNPAGARSTADRRGRSRAPAPNPASAAPANGKPAPKKAASGGTGRGFIYE